MKKHTLLVASLLVITGAAACSKNSTTGPSNSTTTTSSSTTSSSTTSTTTSIQLVLSVSGRVTSDKTGAATPFPVIEIIQGVNINRRVTGNQDGTYTIPNLQPGAFVARYWSDGFFVKDVTITLTTANLNLDVQLTPAPPTTTTTVSAAVTASFSWSPDPCTLGAGGTNCTVTSTSTGDIASTQWLYAGKTVNNQNSLGLTLACGDLIGSGSIRTVSVRLNVTGNDGSTGTVDNGVPVQIVGGFCP